MSKKKTLSIGSLFSGIGGFDKAFQDAGWSIKWQVEKEAFCRRVLRARFPDVPRIPDILSCRGLIASVPASRARMFPSLGSAPDSEDRARRCFLILRDSCRILDQNGLFSRTSQAYLLQTKAGTLPKSCRYSWKNAGMGYRGASLTASFSEYPKGAAVSSLSDVLESHVPPRFYLRPQTCRHLLKRARDRGIELSPLLKKILLSQSSRTPEATAKSKTGKGSRKNRKRPAIRSTPSASMPSPLNRELSETAAEGLVTFAPPSCPEIRAETRRRYSPTLTSNGRCQINIVTPTLRTRGEYSGVRERNEFLEAMAQAVAPTLPAKNEHAGARARMEWREISAHTMGKVRRLTPTEWELLQGFPTGWTQPDIQL